MGKRKLKLPDQYQHRKIFSFFQAHKQDVVTVSTPTSVTDETVNNNNQQRPLSPVADDLEINFDQPQEKRDFKRLKQLSDTESPASQNEEVVDLDLSQLSDEDISLSSSSHLNSNDNHQTNYQSSTVYDLEDASDHESEASDADEDLEEEQRKQLQDNDWLERVVNHLTPRSRPLFHTYNNLRQKFVALKKQWGYNNRYDIVDSNENDCTLCEHPKVGVLFEIKNIRNNEVTYTGSHCIKQFRVLSIHNTFFSKSESRQKIQHDIDSAYKTTAEERREMRQFFG